MSNFRIPTAYTITRVIDNTKAYADSIVLPITTVITAPSMWTKVVGSLYTPTPVVRNIGTSSDTYEILHDGIYNVIFSINTLTTGGVVTRVIQVGVGLNDADPISGIGIISLLGTLETQVVVGNCIVSLKRGDTLSIFVRNDTDTEDIIFVSGNVIANRIM